MTKFAHDDIVPYQKSPLTKKQQVAQMFDSIAFRYDFLNRFLSAGIDISWRRKAIGHLKDIQPKLILDVGTGTADTAIMAFNILNPEKITGIDISEGMLEIGRKKIRKLGLQDNIEILSGDSEAINYSANSFDAITVAFGVRNFENLEKGLFEMYRVLRPGGKLIILECSRPKNSIIKSLWKVYMGIAAPGAGRIFSKNKDAYQYLSNSVNAFPEREQLTSIMQNAGYRQIYFKTLSLGICCIYCGRK